MTDSIPSKQLLARLRNGAAACLKVMVSQTGDIQEMFHQLALVLRESAEEIELLLLKAQQITLERDAMLEDIAALRMAERLNVETVEKLQQERDRLEQCHREGWRYAKEVEDEYRKRTGRGFGDPEPPKEAHPEDQCEKCGGPNACWFAPSEIWNRACKDHSILCPVCFIKLTEASGLVPTSWMIAPEGHAAAKSAQPDDPLAAVRWICSLCTTVNGIDSETCVGCRKGSKPSAEKSAGPRFVSHEACVEIAAILKKQRAEADANGSPAERPDCPHCDGFLVDGIVRHGPRCPEIEKPATQCDPPCPIHICAEMTKAGMCAHEKDECPVVADGKHKVVNGECTHCRNAVETSPPLCPHGNPVDDTEHTCQKCGPVESI